MTYEECKRLNELLASVTTADRRSAGNKAQAQAIVLREMYHLALQLTLLCLMCGRKQSWEEVRLVHGQPYCECGGRMYEDKDDG